MRLDGIDCETLIVEGAPEKAIAVAATELGADLVVVAYQQGLGRSVSEQLVGRLSCAILLVQSGAEAPQIESALAKQA